ncbi:MAG TPA: hypothetical protein VM532_12150 [Burkholderiales bacterium]|nr:hypothetical protein [Burkholderiales bacterium]
MTIEPRNANRVSTPQVAGNRHFYACMGYLTSWIALVGFILYQFQGSDGSKVSLWFAVISLVIVTAIAFAAAFWALCSTWLRPQESLSEASENA